MQKAIRFLGAFGRREVIAALDVNRIRAFHRHKFAELDRVIRLGFELSVIWTYLPLESSNPRNKSLRSTTTLQTGQII